MNFHHIINTKIMKPVLFLFILFLLSCGAPTAPKTTNSTVFQVVEKTMLERLKTIEGFKINKQSLVILPPDEKNKFHFVSFQYEAKNGFGVMVRNKQTMELEFTGTDSLKIDSWTVRIIH